MVKRIHANIVLPVAIADSNKRRKSAKKREKEEKTHLLAKKAKKRVANSK
jgi:hypothetical protein